MRHVPEVPRKDFFISYSQEDEAWATWIADTLEAGGYTTVIQAWDFRPGSNFVLQMQQATESTRRTIMVLSPHFLASSFVHAEWASAFSQDPQGRESTLVPVRVASCEVSGLLRQVVYIDLVGLSEDDAAERLLAGLEPGRNKPVSRTPFPGAVATPQPAPLPRGTLAWRPLNHRLQVFAREHAFPEQTLSSSTQLDISLVPVTGLRVEARRLASLADELTSLGRQAGLFRQSEAVDSRLSIDAVAVSSPSDRDRNGAGLMVTAGGQRTIWHTLSRDSLGAVFDPADLRPRIEALTRTLVHVPVPQAEAYGIALRLRPVTMLSRGRASSLGSRASTSMPYAGRDEISVPAAEAVAFNVMEQHLAEIAEELVARLDATL